MTRTTHRNERRDEMLATALDLLRTAAALLDAAAADNNSNNNTSE